MLPFVPAGEINGLRILFCFMPVRTENNTDCNKAIYTIKSNATIGCSFYAEKQSANLQIKQ